MVMMGKVRGIVRNTPTSLLVCGTVVVCVSIVALTVNVETGRSTAPLLSWLSTIITLLFGGGVLASRVEVGNRKVEDLTNGLMDRKLRDAIQTHVPDILDAYGIREDNRSHEPTHTHEPEERPRGGSSRPVGLPPGRFPRRPQ